MGVQGGGEMITGREHIAGDSTVLLMLSDGLDIELPDFEAVNVTLKGDYLWQVVQIVIGGSPKVLEVCIMGTFMSLGRIQWQGSV